MYFVIRLINFYKRCLVIDLPLRHEYILVTVLDGFSKRLNCVDTKMFLKSRLSPILLGLSLVFTAQGEPNSPTLDLPPFAIEETLNPEPLVEVEDLRSPLKDPTVRFRRPSSLSETKIAAIVNNEIISSIDLESRMKLITGNSLKKLPPDQLAQLQSSVLRSLIDERLELQAAKRAEISVSEGEINDFIRNIERQNNLPPGGFKKDLKAKGIPEETLIQLAKARTTWMKYVGTYYRDSFHTTDKELGETLNEELVTIQPRYHLAEIELYVETPEDEPAVLEQANEVLKLLKKGKPFTGLAQQYSQSPSATRGGSIGWIQENQLEEEILPILRRLTPGQISPPIRTETSYKIIFVIDKKDQNTEEEILTARQLEVPLDSRLTQDKLALKKETKRLNDLVATATNCEEFDQLADQIPNAQVHVYKNVRLFDLSPDLQRSLEKRKIGVPGEGLLDENGNLVFFMVCERKHVKATTITPSQQVADRMSNQRFEATAQQKLRELRRIASIDVRI